MISFKQLVSVKMEDTITQLKMELRKSTSEMVDSMETFRKVLSKVEEKLDILSEDYSEEGHRTLYLLAKKLLNIQRQRMEKDFEVFY